MITPEMEALANEHGWVWVKLTDILATIEDSADMGGILYGSDAYGRWMSEEFTDDDRTTFWQRMIAQKSADRAFGELVRSIQERGWTSSICWREDEHYIGNGHHRLAAAILLCEEYVPTSYFGSIWSERDGEMGWDDEDESDDGQIISWSDAIPEHPIYVEV
jgi:hypothetical protein